MRRTPEMVGLVLVSAFTAVSTARAQGETSTTTMTPPPPAVEQPVEATPAEPVAAEPEAKKAAEELVITGSRIRRLDLATPAPVAVLGKQEIQDSGLASVGQILQNLPSQSNAINVQFNNGGDGSTRVNLRGLGEERTLVLLNGRRFVAGGIGANSSVDLNAIPLSIIDHIEVLKDGASAVYGSDAIGGVVNVITKSDFSGVEGSAYVGSGQVGGLIYDLSVSAGHTTEKGNILFSFSLFDQDDIFAAERDFSNPDRAYDYVADLDEDGMPDCAPNCNADINDDNVSTLGSSSIPQTYIRDYGEDDGNAAWNQIVEANMDLPGPSAYLNDPVDGWRKFKGTGTRDSGEGDQYNYQPENYLLTPSQRYSFFALGSYELFEAVNVFGEASYTNRQSDQLLAPEPLFTINEGIVVSEDSIYNPFGRDFIDVRRRFTEAGPRRFLDDVDTYRAVVGLNGGLPDGLGVLSDWKWEGSFNYGRTEGTEIKQGLLVRPRLANALGPSFVDADGVPTCGTPEAPIAGCVPLDLFSGEGSITKEMLDYITYTGTKRGFSQQQVVDLGVNGPLFSLFERDIGLAVGYQYRDEEGGVQPDPLTESGDTTGNKEEATNGGYRVNAVYGELNFPLHFDIPAVETIEVNGALRFVNIKADETEANPDPASNSELTWKAGLRWQLFDFVALRGSASRSFRAPSIGELFSGTADDFPAVDDPCSAIDASTGEPRTLTPNQATNCAAQGVPVPDAQGNGGLQEDRAQFQSRVGGNTQLEPETANTFTGGVVITPKFASWIDGLSITVDYFNVAINNAIDPYGANIILANCYSVDPSLSQGCELINRNDQNFIDTISDTETNISGGIRTAGLDMSLAYKLPTDFGNFRYSIDATWLQKYNAKYSDLIEIEGKNVYDLGVFPDWRFNTTLAYGIYGFHLGLNVRFVNGYRECEGDVCLTDQDFDGMPDDFNGDGVINNTDAPADINGDGTVDPIDAPNSRKVKSYATADVFAGYRLAWDGGVTDITAGINNIANTTPPFLDNGFLANSDAATYDFIGRYFYVGLSHTF
jgi:iron complex outermembrane recepter protein